MDRLIIFCLSTLSLFSYSQVDIRTEDQFVVITSLSDTLLISEFMLDTRIETMQDVIVTETIDSVNSRKLELYDTTGFFEKNKLYSYNNMAIQCLQTHSKTTYLPEQIPALFAMYRNNSDTLTWIVGEKVMIGWIRIYNDTSYECLQSHITIIGREPDIAHSLWEEIESGKK